MYALLRRNKQKTRGTEKEEKDKSNCRPADNNPFAGGTVLLFQQTGKRSNRAADKEHHKQPPYGKDERRVRRVDGDFRRQLLLLRAYRARRKRRYHPDNRRYGEDKQTDGAVLHDSTDPRKRNRTGRNLRAHAGVHGLAAYINLGCGRESGNSGGGRRALLVQKRVYGNGNKPDAPQYLHRRRRKRGNNSAH